MALEGAAVEWLRQCCAHFGEWSSKLAPLYFERVLKEYPAGDIVPPEMGLALLGLPVIKLWLGVEQTIGWHSAWAPGCRS